VVAPQEQDWRARPGIEGDQAAKIGAGLQGRDEQGGNGEGGRGEMDTARCGRHARWAGKMELDEERMGSGRHAGRAGKMGLDEVRMGSGRSTG
jgi:hypothetical protein